MLTKGDTYSTKNYGDITVVDVISSRNVTIIFNNTGNIVENVQAGNVVRGSLKDRMAPTVEGVGYIGETKTKNVTSTGAYKTWKKMLVRCYSKNYHNKRPTYVGCSVDKEWHNFSNFEEWYHIHHRDGFVLDKDLLVQGNKKYSKDTCSFIPPSINSAITDNCLERDGCTVGVSKRKKKGTTIFNGRFNVSIGNVYLGRFSDPLVAEEVYREFKALVMSEMADQYETLGLLTPKQSAAMKEKYS